MTSDPYIDPRTGILRNKLGLQTQEELSKAEYKFVASRSTELSAYPVKGNFDLKHLQAIHKYQFHDVYEWAGKIRTVNISKGNSPFARTEFIESFMKDVHRRLEKNNFLRGLEKKEFVEKFTDFYGDINAAHPFREGNGRSTREFMAQLAEQAGYILDQSAIKNKDAWNKASEQSVYGQMEPLKAILNDAIQPRERQATRTEGQNLATALALSVVKKNGIDPESPRGKQFLEAVGVEAARREAAGKLPKIPVKDVKAPIKKREADISKPRPHRSSVKKEVQQER